MATIALQDDSLKPGNQPTEVQNLSEAETLPEWAEQLFPKIQLPTKVLTDNHTSTAHYVPYVDEWKVLLRRIMESGNMRTHESNFDISDGWYPRVNKVDPGDTELFKESLKNDGLYSGNIRLPLAMKEITIGGENAIVFVGQHQNWEPLLYYYVGDKKNIKKLIDAYSSVINIGAVSEPVKWTVNTLAGAPVMNLIKRLTSAYNSRKKS